jgi:two-component system chemotaxis sensor kinase CheA
MSSNEILREFLLETHENLALLDADLLTLEKNPAHKETLAQVFRTLHSVKGTAGFMGLVKLQAVAHASESLLSRLRAGEMRFTPAIATALLQVVDAIRGMLVQIERDGSEGEGDYTTVIAEVDRLREAGNQSDSAAVLPTAASAVEKSVEAAPALRAAADSAATIDHTSLPLPSLKPVAVQPAPFPVPPPAPPPTLAVPSNALSATVELPPSEPPESRAPSTVESSIRVDVHLLDKLMTLMGELVLARNQILQYSALLDDGGFLGAVQRLNLLTTELQTSVMKTRMQPIGNVLSKFPRIVRDLAVACSKKVRFEMEGQETELDKTLLEAIRDPLTHMVRNAIDHGIEPPEVRKSSGKPEEGRLRMVAFHEGGKVIVEITDDGGGIDVAGVRDKALQAKLVTPQAARTMSKQELLQLIFLPGFSTAERVTQFSGRGVGMDVVRTNIEKIGGSVDLESSAGQGTTIRTKIPLTLAIIPALIIVCGGERYAIPQVSLLELVRIDAQSAIEWLHGAPVYRLRGTLLPLVFLNEQLQCTAPAGDAEEINIVVLQVDERPFGLVVDAIRDTEEIVVKPLQKQLKGIAVFAGAAIMGDGRVALVLDVLGLAQQANVVSNSKSRAIAEAERPASSSVAEAEPLLLFASQAGGQMAIPLSQVARLEEFSRDRLEVLGSQQVVQYRGEILSLCDVSEAIGHLQSNPPQRNSSVNGEADVVPVIVYAQGDRQVGLVVDRILDIVADPVAARSPANRPGVLFTAVVQDKVTEVVDVPALLDHLA